MTKQNKYAFELTKSRYKKQVVPSKKKYQKKKQRQKKFGLHDQILL